MASSNKKNKTIFSNVQAETYYDSITATIYHKNRFKENILVGTCIPQY
jgi:hypothetical protein